MKDRRHVERRRAVRDPVVSILVVVAGQRLDKARRTGVTNYIQMLLRRSCSLLNVSYPTEKQIFMK